MDCEKFESTLMDELYDELDELTSAASKRHVAGCARCASLLHGLSATRRIAVLERVEPPPGLEERILAATKEAQKVVPLRGRISRVVSWAGSWAMRPQTAMAAVFLLMIGSTSILLLRARSASVGLGGVTMVVTEKGEPAASAPADEENSIDPAHAASAHGAFEARKGAGAGSGAAAPSTASSDSFLGGAKDDDSRKADSVRGAMAAADEKERARGPVALAPEAPAALEEPPPPMNASAPAGAAAPAPSPYATATAPPQQPVTQAAQQQQGMQQQQAYGHSPAARPTAGSKSAPMAESKAIAKAGEGGGDTFASAMASYQARNYDEATRAFDVLAASGDTNAALMAARSVRDSSGCPVAVARFDQVSARAYGTRAGYDATFEGGVCYRNMGSVESARSHFAQLLTVPTHAARAQAQLDAMNPRAANRAAAPSQAAPPAKKSSPDGK